MNQLAIIIPAYKARYFEQTLNSLANQTNKNFNLYIGDDCSPFDLGSIVDKFNDRLTISYTRFLNNVGAKNLVHQWKRCIDLVNKEEKWLWLFSDDDIADSNCVEQFYATIADNGQRFDVLRFNTVTIDGKGDLLRNNPTGPAEESSVEMAFYLLQGLRGNSMPDHVFTKEIYEDSGGFVVTDFAQGADWATSILFAEKSGICIIPQAKVYWRYSGDNISSTTHKSKCPMLIGHLQFIDWILNHFAYLKQYPAGNITYEMIHDAAKINLGKVVIHHFKGFDRASFVILYKFYRKGLGLSITDTLQELFDIKEATSPAVAKLKSLFIRAKNRLTINRKQTVRR